MSSVQNFSLWIELRRVLFSTPPKSPVPSSLRGSHRRPVINPMRKARWCEPPISLDSWAIPTDLRKANALYAEFEEAGMNRQTRATNSPADLTDKYPQFYYHTVAPHIQRAIRYLNVTSSGRQWIASLYSNVFRAGHELKRPDVRLTVDR